MLSRGFNVGKRINNIGYLPDDQIDNDYLNNLL